MELELELGRENSELASVSDLVAGNRDEMSCCIPLSSIDLCGEKIAFMELELGRENSELLSVSDLVAGNSDEMSSSIPFHSQRPLPDSELSGGKNDPPTSILSL